MTPEQELQSRINRQISQLRAKDQHKLDCNCGECLTDWHDDSRWPQLFRELPKGTRLAELPVLEVRMWICCGCESEGRIRTCNVGEDLGRAVCGAWIAFTLGSRIVGEMPDFSMFEAPGSNSVH